jgi:hypothetical protein
VLEAAHEAEAMTETRLVHIHAPGSKPGLARCGTQPDGSWFVSNFRDATCARCLREECARFRLRIDELEIRIKELKESCDPP